MYPALCLRTIFYIAYLFSDFREGGYKYYKDSLAYKLLFITFDGYSPQKGNSPCHFPLLPQVRVFVLKADFKFSVRSIHIPHRFTARTVIIIL